MSRVAPILLKRAYEPAAPEDGRRFLVERLWPRGVRKADLRLDGWLKDVAPSPGLRRWFGHDPDKWPEFRRRYFQLNGYQDGWVGFQVCSLMSWYTFITYLRLRKLYTAG